MCIEVGTPPPLILSIFISLFGQLLAENWREEKGRKKKRNYNGIRARLGKWLSIPLDLGFFLLYFNHSYVLTMVLTINMDTKLEYMPLDQESGYHERGVIEI